MNIGLVGARGEDMVARFLVKKGYGIIKRNYQCRFGELDIVARNTDYIIFVEVKTRKKDSLVPPEFAVDARKQQRITLTAEDFLSKYECDLQPRFDVALVTVDSNAKTGSGYSLKYIENAF